MGLLTKKQIQAARQYTVRRPGEDSAFLSGQELATVLAALRYYQEHGQGEPDNRSDAIHDIATNGGQEISMDAAGIDALCERLNG